MRGTIDPTRSGAAWALARRQHGVVARRQLLALGFDRKAIQRRIDSGRLHPLGRGVYAVGRRELNKHGRWMAAVLHCGSDAVLSHRSAGALWGICANRERNEATRGVDVTIVSRRRLRRPNIRPHRRPSLPATSLTIEHGIPVTTPIQTLIDLATELPTGKLERAVNDADKHDRVDPETLRAALDSQVGEPGVKRLRDLLDRDTFVLTDDELERFFLPIAKAAGLPVALTKQIVNEFEVDFHWPHLALVVETDGLRYHRTAAAQAKDIRRDQAHTAAGTARLRFSHWQVAHEPSYVRSILSRTRRRLEAGS
jgi:hypothetical protein